MSFVKKAVKKVFKFVKRLVKNKIFQLVAIIALSVFTAGLAAGGFAAFGGAMSAAGGGLTGFFTAVGQTLATGASVLTGAVGMSGTSAALAGKGGAMALSAGLATNATTAATIAGTAASQAAAAGAAGNVAAAQAAGQIATTAASAAHIAPAAGTVAAKAAAAGAVTASTGGSGWVSATKSVLGKKVLGDVTVGQMATTFATTGMSNYMKQKNAGDEYKKVYVAGDWAFGGGKEHGTQASWGTENQPSRGLQSAATAKAGTAAAPEDTRMEQPSEAAQLASNAGLVGAGQEAVEDPYQKLGTGFNNVSLRDPEGRAAAREMLAQKSDQYDNLMQPSDIQIEQGQSAAGEDQFNFSPSRINYKPQGGLV